VPTVKSRRPCSFRLHELIINEVFKSFRLQTSSLSREREANVIFPNRITYFPLLHFPSGLFIFISPILTSLTFFFFISHNFTKWWKCSCPLFSLGKFFFCVKIQLTVDYRTVSICFKNIEWGSVWLVPTCKPLNWLPCMQYDLYLCAMRRPSMQALIQP